MQCNALMNALGIDAITGASAAAVKQKQRLIAAKVGIHVQNLVVWVESILLGIDNKIRYRVVCESLKAIAIHENFYVWIRYTS